jgi:hypothetical protein
MIEIDSTLYDYPVTLNDEEFKSATGIDLKTELGAEQDVEARDWLNAAHENVYNRIYKIGGKSLKDGIIVDYIDYLQKPIKRCLIAELKYMLNANGDYGVADGSNVNADGQLVVVDKERIIPKILAPKVVEILKSARPNLLMGEV